MNMNLFEQVRDQYGSAACDFLGQLWNQKPQQLRHGVDTAIGTVLDTFGSVAADAGGRELLYESIRYCDDAVVENPAEMFRDRDTRDVFNEANNRLAGLVGASNKSDMVRKLTAQTGLSELDAENVLGYVAPGVMGVLKRQIGNGSVLDNPDGIGQLFLGEGNINNIDTSKRRDSGAHGSGAAVAGHSDGTDASWLFRYALPALLLGGLVIGGLNNCSNRAENQIVAAQESKIQLELDGARQEAEAANAKIVSLQGEFDTANATIATLQSDFKVANTGLAGLQGEYDAVKVQTEELTARADGLTLELDTAKGRVVELEEELATAAAEGEAARLEIEAASAETARLNAQADALNGDLEAARARVSGLQGDLEVSRAETAGFGEQVQRITAELNLARDMPKETSELQGLLMSARADRDASAGSVAEIQAKLDVALNDVEMTNDQVVQVQTRLNEARAVIAAKDKELEQVGVLEAQLNELANARDEAVGQNTELSGLKAGLEQQLEASDGEIDHLGYQLRKAREKVTDLETKLALTNEQLETEKSVRLADVNRLTGTSDDLQSQLTAMLGMRDEAVGNLSLRNTEITGLGEQITTLKSEVVSLEDANAKAREQAAALQQKIDSLNGELTVTQGNVDTANQALAEREQSLSSVNTNLESAKADIASLTTERDELLSRRDALSARVKELVAEQETLVVERDGVQAKSQALNDTITGLTANLEQVTQARDDSNSQLGLLNESLGGLQKELRIVTGAKDEASDLAKSFRSKSVELTGQVGKLESELAEARVAHEQALAAMQNERDSVASTLDATKTELSGEIGTLSDKLNVTTADLEKAATDLATLNEEKAKALADIAALQQQAATMQSSLEERTAEIGGLQTNITDLEGQNMSLTQSGEESAAKVVMLGDEINTLKSALDGEQSNVVSLNQRIEELKSSNASLDTDKTAALASIAKLEADREKLLAELASLTGQRDTLQQQQDEAAARLQARIANTLALRSDIEYRLTEAGIDTATVRSIEDDTAVAITLGSGDLYGVGSAQLSKAGNELIGGVSQAILNHPEWKVDVEGHTDSQNIGAGLRNKYPTNWELSTARASAAVRFLASRAGLDADRISAKGFGDTRPVASNDTAEGREQNRRVDIILRK